MGRIYRSKKCFCWLTWNWIPDHIFLENNGVTGTFADATERLHTIPNKPVGLADAILDRHQWRWKERFNNSKPIGESL